MTKPLPAVELLVCTRCRHGEETPDDDDARPGATLFDQLAGAAIGGVSVTPVECLSNCSKGCTIALRGPGRWTYVYGGLQPGADIGTILEGAGKYRAAPDGLVPWRERPEHFRKNCIARIPPLEPAIPSLGDA
jgi:predicted metal-binding protein